MQAWVVLGVERMPYSQAALDLAGFKCGHVIESCDEIERLTAAEAAVLAASELLFRIRARLLGATE